MAAKDPFDALRTSLIECFDSSKYSDLIIRCEDREFKVHRIVVCGQSKYFSKICDGDWKEAVEGVITLKEDDVHAVEAMLRFLYGSDYDVVNTDDPTHLTPILFHIRVYAVADKYHIPTLKLRAQEKFNNVIRNFWRTDDFARAIAEIYSTTVATDRGLRDKVVELAYLYRRELVDKKSFVHVLEETAGFAADLVQYMVRKEAHMRI